MKRIFLTATVLAVSLSSLAEQPHSKVVVQETSDSLLMTSIEDKNQDIMSSYKNYSQRHQQQKLLKQDRIHQQYSQFMEEKSISSSTVSL